MTGRKDPILLDANGVRCRLAWVADGPGYDSCPSVHPEHLRAAGYVSALEHEEAANLLQLLHNGRLSVAEEEILEKLELYLQQQHALEADTVSRGELSEEKKRGDDHLAAYIRRGEQLTALQAEHERVKLDFANTCDVGRRLEARVAELIAESQGHDAALATERARAEEMEDGLRTDLRGANEELAAANARAERLVELAKELWDEGNERNGPRDYCSIAERIRSALRGGGSHPTEQSEGQDLDTAALRETILSAPQASAFIHDQGAINEVSPSPAVGDAWDEEAAAAQPAPGGTERCPERVTYPSGSYRECILPAGHTGVHPLGLSIDSTPAEPHHQWQSDGTHSVCARCGVVDLKGNRAAFGLCSAEPQGRPEQAGDRPVMLSELVEALRCAADGLSAEVGNFAFELCIALREGK